MNASWGIIGFVLMAVVGLIGFVVRTEYPDWGRRLAHHLVRFAAAGLDPPWRQVRREEWLAELDATWRDTDKRCTGLSYASCLAVRYGVWSMAKTMAEADLLFFVFGFRHAETGAIAEPLASVVIPGMVGVVLGLAARERYGPLRLKRQIRLPKWLAVPAVPVAVAGLCWLVGLVGVTAFRAIEAGRPVAAIVLAVPTVRLAYRIHRAGRETPVRRAKATG